MPYLNKEKDTASSIDFAGTGPVPKHSIQLEVENSDTTITQTQQQQLEEPQHPHTDQDLSDHPIQIEQEVPEQETQTEIDLQPSTSRGLNDYLLSRDRPRRSIKPPERYEGGNLIAYALHSAKDLETNKPKTYAEAVSSPLAAEWKKAMNEEMQSLLKNKTWVLVNRPKK